MAEWVFRVMRDRDGLYFARLINAAGTEIWKDADGHDTAEEAELAAKRTRKRIAEAEIASELD